MQLLTMNVVKVGYEKYTSTGQDPIWDQLPDNIVNAWFMAADGMIKFLASIDNYDVVED